MRTSNLHGRSAITSKPVRCGSKGVLRDAFLLALLATVPASTALAKAHPKHLQAAVNIVADGTVVNTSKAPINNAVVYLENPTSLVIKSYLTDASGHFHFNQLSPQTDYEVWAEQNGVESKHKFISRFSDKPRFTFTLKLDSDKHKFLGFL